MSGLCLFQVLLSKRLAYSMDYFFSTYSSAKLYVLTGATVTLVVVSMRPWVVLRCAPLAISACARQVISQPSFLSATVRLAGLVRVQRGELGRDAVVIDQWCRHWDRLRQSYQSLLRYQSGACYIKHEGRVGIDLKCRLCQHVKSWYP